MTKNSSNFSNQQSLQSLQNEARNAIEKNIAANKIAAIDDEGMAQSLEIEEGKPRPENIIAFAGEGANEVADKLEPLYQRFRELNFEAMMKEGRDEDANKYFFGVIFPQEYRGNIDPLTMTQEQVEQAQKSQQVEREQEKSSQKSAGGKSGAGSWAESVRSAKNVHTESVGENSAKMPAFHQEEKDGWLKEILAKGPRDNGSSFAERLRRESLGMER